MVLQQIFFFHFSRKVSSSGRFFPSPKSYVFKLLLVFVEELELPQFRFCLSSALSSPIDALKDLSCASRLSIFDDLVVKFDWEFSSSLSRWQMVILYWRRVSIHHASLSLIHSFSRVLITFQNYYFFGFLSWSKRWTRRSSQLLPEHARWDIFSFTSSANFLTSFFKPLKLECINSPLTFINAARLCDRYLSTITFQITGPSSSIKISLGRSLLYPSWMSESKMKLCIIVTDSCSCSRPRSDHLFFFAWTMLVRETLPNFLKRFIFFAFLYHHDTLKPAGMYPSTEG